MGKMFISYARADDEPFVRQLYHDLTEHGFDIWWDREKMESRGLTFLQEIRDAIEGSDRLIAVIGQNAVKSEYVRVEWEHALLFSKGVVPILRMGDYNLVPPELSKFHCPDFRKERPYQDALAELCRILAEPVPELGAYRTAVPSLPPHFMARRDEIVRLGEAVLADVQRPAVITPAKQITAIVGMGGSGKSVLAAAFARATDTRRAFKDGVIWLSIGQKPDMLSKLKQLGMAFGDKLEKYVDIETAKMQLPQVLADKACLIVLDDIWNVAHATPFINALGQICRLLITTRDGSLVTALGAQEHRLGVLTDAAALQFLANWCGKEVGSLPPEAVSVAKECGNLPFALALCGAMARDGNPWSDMLDALKEADLTFIEKQFPNYPYTDVLKSLKISVDALASEDPEGARHYQDLVVFAKHAPEAAIMTLWLHTGGLKERDARKLLTTLERKAMLRLDGEAPNRLVSLHDLQHDYLRAVVGDMKGLHGRLLEAYQQKCKDGWQGGPNDGYFFEHLAYHLVEAGRKDDLRLLLFNFAWLQAKLVATDANALIRDYDFLPDDPGLHLVQSAIRLSAHILAQDKTQLRSQLYGRLMKQKSSGIKVLLDQIGQGKGGYWLRPLISNLTSVDEPLIRTLESHKYPITSVAVAADGKRAISSEDSEIIKVWDLVSGEVLLTLRDFAGPFRAIAITPDGKLGIYSSDDKKLKVRDLESGDELFTLEGHNKETIEVIAVTADKKRGISGSWDNTLKVWDLENGKLLHTLEGHTGWIRTIAVMPDARHIISGSYDHTLRVWDIESGKLIHKLEGHKELVTSVAITKEGNHAISGSTDGTVRVWDLKSGKEIHFLKCYGQIWIVAITPDGRRILAASHSEISIWDLESGNLLHTLKGHTDAIQSVAVTPDGLYAISASDDKTLRIWDIENGVEMRTLKGHANQVWAVAVMPDGQRFISASKDKTLKIWDIESCTSLKDAPSISEGHTARLHTILVTPDGRRAISASEDGTLKVWDLDTGEVLQTIKGYYAWVEKGKSVKTVALMPDGRRVISVSNDNTLKVLDLESGELLRTLEGHTDLVNAVVVTQDGQRAISASSDETVRVWDLESGKVVHTLKSHTNSVNSVAVTRDGRRIFSASEDKTLKIWDMESGELLRTIEGETKWVSGVAVTPDGRRVILADNWGLNVWDLESVEDEEPLPLEGRTERITTVVVTPDGRQVISGSSYDLKIWDLDSRKLLCILKGHTFWVNAVVVTPDGRQVISASGDKSLKVWDIKIGKVIASFSGDSPLTACAVSPDGKTIVAGERLGKVHFLRLEGAS